MTTNVILSFIFGTVIGGIVLNVLGGLLTNRIENWLVHRSLINKHRKADMLKKDLERITKLKESGINISLDKTILFGLVGVGACFSTELFGATVLVSGVSISGLFELGSTTIYPPDFTPVMWAALILGFSGGMIFCLGMYGLLLTSLSIRKSIIDRDRLIYFEEFKAETEKQISTLLKQNNKK